MTDKKIFLDGETLNDKTLLELGHGDLKIDLTEKAWQKVRLGRKVVDDVIESGKVVYGVNTGFGNFSDVVVSTENVNKLQRNLIRSHAAGVGKILNLKTTRIVLALRINTLAKGFSGISENTLRHVISFFNSGCFSEIPKQGTLGASGDLAPLAHLTLGMMGEGNMWNPKTKKYEHAAEVLKQNGLEILQLKAKEGLAMINGTQFITSLGVVSLCKAKILVPSADFICALSLEALKGTYKAFLPEIHAARPHLGQIKSAQNIRKCLHSSTFPSEIYLSHENCSKVQDAYSLRCTPQVHGIVYQTVEFVEGILQTEMNSATDNPMVFSDTNEIVSGGNFHGEYPAKALDYLAIAVHELSNISERRIERLLNSNLSELYPFLVKEGGLNSGFMVAHCTAAALVSENKTLCHPASVDSIPTSAQKEDHVSMGGWAARKCLRVMKNVEYVLAIELLAVCQAIDLRRPLMTTLPLEKVHAEVRALVQYWDKDRYMKPDIEKVAKFIRDGGIIKAVQSVISSHSKL